MAEGGGAKEAPVEQQASLTVALRIRPLNEEEIIQGATPVAHKVDKNMVVLMDPADDPDDILRAKRSREKQYMFDVCLDGATSQKEVYDKTCRVLIPDVINGYNATVFAYGATGAGKTHTMLGSDQDPGIMAQALNDLFREMAKNQDSMKYKVTMSYLEIYNEMIRDLLAPELGYLDLREDSKGVQVAGLSEISARSTGEVMDILVQGNKQRTSEPTAANKTSSRSHAVLQITVRQRNRERGTMQQVRIGKLFLIDLAGSERAANTLNRGKRMVEGAHINRSLLALGNCINALSDKNGARYVNYRDSKLTRLLKDALGGNCKTVMIAHISPASLHFEESRNTLVYADRAKNIKTKVRRNVMDVSYHITQYTNIINDLRVEIRRLRDKLDDANVNSMRSVHEEPARKESRGQLQQFKDSLTDIFHEQMELRRSLMELNTTAMEISLETTRNQLLVKKWERERTTKRRDDEDDKLRDLAGQGSDDLPVPYEVKQAQEELRTLKAEKDRTERIEANVKKQLENAKEKAAKIETTLPSEVSSAEQQEILSLLCKVHELEIENMEMQSACLLHNFELRKKDMVVVKYEQHRLLCDEIIQQQRVLMEEQKVGAPPKELDELYELYQQENGELMLERNVSLPDIHAITNKFPNMSLTNMSKGHPTEGGETISDRSERLAAVEEHLPRLFVHSENKQNKQDRNRRAANRYDDSKSTSALFSQSPKAKQIRAEQEKENLRAYRSSGNVLPSPAPRQQSIITLSSRSNHTTPTPERKGATKPVKAVKKEREEIASNTRNIAALAARRKAHKDTVNLGLNDPTLNKTSTSLNNDVYLTQSRLAQHDRNFGSSATLNHLLGEDALSQPAERSLYRPAQPVATSTVAGPSKAKHPFATAAKPHKKRVRSQDYAGYQQLSKTTPRHAARNVPEHHGAAGNKRSRIPAAAPAHQARHSKPMPQAVLGADLLSVEAPPTPTTVRQSNSDRGKGQMIQKKVRGGVGTSMDTVSMNSHTSEPMGRVAGGKKRPTIPNSYRKGDFRITGYGLSGR